MNNIKTDFTIKDLENISGIKAHTIRIWEKRYNLLQPNRTTTNIRFYSSKSLQKLLNIAFLNKHGIKISKIADMSEETMVARVKEIAFRDSFHEEAINTLKLAMFQFDRVLFNNTYNNLLHKSTFREVFKDVFIPFLHQIGLLWQTDTLLPAHEHFISNLIAHKVQVNIERLQYNIPESKTTYVLFLPLNEIHELGLMYLDYELVLRGNKTIYLGQSLPLDNLNHFFNSEEKICFITSMTVKPDDDDLQDYFNQIDSILENSSHSLIAFGPKTQNVRTKGFKSNISILPSLPDLLNSL